MKRKLVFETVTRKKGGFENFIEGIWATIRVLGIVILVVWDLWISSKYFERFSFLELSKL